MQPGRFLENTRADLTVLGFLTELGCLHPSWKRYKLLYRPSLVICRSTHTPIIIFFLSFFLSFLFSFFLIFFLSNTGTSSYIARAYYTRPKITNKTILKHTLFVSFFMCDTTVQYNNVKLVTAGSLRLVRSESEFLYVSRYEDTLINTLAMQSWNCFAESWIISAPVRL